MSYAIDKDGTAITYYLSYPSPPSDCVTKIVKEQGEDKKIYDRNSRAHELLFIEADRQFSDYLSRINEIIKTSVLR